MRKKRILFAAVDIGYRIEDYTEFINKNFTGKLEVESFSKYVLPESHYKTKYTYTCPIDKKHPLLVYTYCLFFFVFSLFRYDIFHFLSGETILTRRLRPLELCIYKLFGKRVIMHFVGSDVRSEDFINWKADHIKEFLEGVNDFPKKHEWQDKMIKDSVKYADSILVSTPDLISLVPGSKYYPVMLNLEKYTREINLWNVNKQDRKEVVILHSPSSVKKHKLKGTDYIIKVLKKIENEGKYKVRLILPSLENKNRSTNYSATRYELFKYYQEADIVIDQLVIGWYGLISVEALSAGKQVISYIDEDLKGYLFPACPIQIAKLNTLESVIIKCIENVLNNKLEESFSFNWVNKYHTLKNNNQLLLESWDVVKS